MKFVEKNQNGFSAIGIVAVVAVLVVLAGGWYFAYQRFAKPVDTGRTACSAEAKLCPDGSSVSRTGSNCGFAECPIVGGEINISGWKTYRNEKYGFEFRYPAEMNVVREDTPGSRPYVERLSIWSGKNVIRIETYTDRSVEPWNKDCEPPCSLIRTQDLDIEGYSSPVLSVYWRKSKVFKTEDGFTRVVFSLHFFDFDITIAPKQKNLSDETLQNLIIANKIPSSAGGILKIYNEIVPSVKIFK